MKKITAFLSGIYIFLNMGVNAQTIATAVDAAPSDHFTYDGQSIPHYGLQWTSDSWTTTGPTAWFTAYGGMKFFTMGALRFTIAPGGNIGIGTLNPQGLLNINAGVASGFTALKFGGPGDAGNLQVPYKTATGGYNIDFATWRDINPDQIGARIRAERINLWQNNNALAQGMDLVFYTNPADGVLQERLRISNEGNVLIGKSAQQNNSYRLDINGNMRANSVVVNTTGADFVFDSAYKLASLQQVEAFIKKHRHLEGIPDAKTMQQNGADVGALQTKLLQKMEELTLHLIKMEKRVTAQEKKINALQKENCQLKQNRK